MAGRYISLLPFLLLAVGCSFPQKSGQVLVANFAKVDSSLVVLQDWRAGVELTCEDISRFGGAEHFFSACLIDSVLFDRMDGKSYKLDCPVKIKDLRYLHLLHKDAEGRILTGEMVCGKAVAEDLLEIFLGLYNAGYPIESIRLIDDFDAEDEASMAANNTSCFNYRPVPAASGGVALSNHCYGLAVDINPLYNPYVKGETVLPESARSYVDRTGEYPYKIANGDLCCKLFASHGFKWGGNWRSLKDYQHFEKR